ncbi:Hsp20/alpha crystallin family protein [Flavobacteriaceae bacterium SZ-1-7]|uniref:hypothetical protein n=1 Tax=Tamlana sedimenti TaxID=3134126 RepID=UPI0031282198
MPQTKKYGNELKSVSRLLQRSLKLKDDLKENLFSISKLNNLKITETEKCFHYELKLPGYIKDDFNFYLDNGNLVVTTDKSKLSESAQEENFSKKKHFYCYPSARFKIKIPLPDKLIKKEIDVDYADEVLKFDLLKLP